MIWMMPNTQKWKAPTVPYFNRLKKILINITPELCIKSDTFLVEYN